MEDQFIWCERYRPQTIDQCILPDYLKDTFNKFVADNNIPNLLLSGPAGGGKTTVAKAMLEQMGCDYIVINGSMNGNIDTLRTIIQQFASSVSFSGGRKYVIIDEGDYLSNLTQASLRNFMEEYSSNCGFILTCNYKNRIIDPLHSRCSVIEFRFSKQQVEEMSLQFMKRCADILKSNNIDYDPKAIATLVMRHRPDWRRVLNELQRFSASGKIDLAVVVSANQQSFNKLIGYMKDKNFTEVRKWVGEQTFDDSINIFRQFYDYAGDTFTKASIPVVVITLGKYQQYATQVADQEINLAACLAELMIEAEFE